MRARHLIAAGLLAATGCASLTPPATPEAPADPSVASPVDSATDPVTGEMAVPVTEPVAEAAVTQVDAGPVYDTVWERVIDRFALPSCSINATAARWADWYAGHPEYLQRVFKRAQPWVFDIAEEIERRDMPGEFALLPVVESAYDPFAYSRGRAVGTWQFISATGKRYGLQQNWWYDGRRDVYAATRAALDYLQDLGELFEQDWLLALAGYNAGENRVRRAVKRNHRAGKDADYWNLSLPRETRGYVPKLLGLSCIFKDPAAYGITLPTWPNEPVVAAVDTGRQTDLVLAAQLAGISVTELFALNPGYNRWATAPAGPHRIILPVEKAADFVNRLDSLATDALMRWDQITVVSGDSLGKLAARYRVPVAVIKNTNGLSGDMIRVGQKLRLPRDATDRIDPLYASAAGELQRLQAKLVAPDRVSHRVRRGESLSTIAKRYRVRVSDLQRWNGIRNPNRLRAGQTLAIFHSPVARPAAAKRAGRYTVQRGDSLWTIARRHNLNMKDLMRWNQLNAKSVLRPGQRLKLNP